MVDFYAFAQASKEITMKIVESQFDGKNEMS